MFKQDESSKQDHPFCQELAFPELSVYAHLCSNPYESLQEKCCYYMHTAERTCAALHSNAASPLCFINKLRSQNVQAANALQCLTGLVARLRSTHGNTARLHAYASLSQVHINHIVHGTQAAMLCAIVMMKV